MCSPQFNIWEIYGNCIGDLLEKYGKYMVIYGDLLEKYRKYMVISGDLLEKYGKYMMIYRCTYLNAFKMDMNGPWFLMIYHDLSWFIQ